LLLSLLYHTCVPGGSIFIVKGFVKIYWTGQRQDMAKNIYKPLSGFKTVSKKTGYKSGYSLL